MRNLWIVPLVLCACAVQHSQPTASGTVASAASVSGDHTPLPADAAHVAERLTNSPRHGEYAMVHTPDGDSVKVWIVYPQRATPAPVVVVIHEIYGLSSWVRGVADQLAADGFVAIAPDLLTMTNAPRVADTVATQDATVAFRTLNADRVQRQIDAVAKYAMDLPGAAHTYGIVGFCRGGDFSFGHAAHSPSLGASIVYYGIAPPAAALQTVRAPVLGLYGGADARVDATIAPTDSAMRALGKTYVHFAYDSAGHGFLRQQDGMNGANMRATQQAWPATIAWLRKYLGG